MRRLSNRKIDKLVTKAMCLSFWSIGGLYTMLNIHPFIGYIMGTIAIIIFMKPEIIE